MCAFVPHWAPTGKGNKGSIRDIQSVATNFRSGRGRSLVERLAIVSKGGERAYMGRVAKDRRPSESHHSIANPK